MFRSLASSTARLRHAIGIDGSVGFTALARICSIASSVGTVLLLVRFLNPVEQGYYYTMLSLAVLQTVFELGFSFVIQQFAAHESVLCTLTTDGRVEGDAGSHGRLASLLRLALGWYLCAAIIIALILLPMGFLFFSGKSQAVGHVAWQWPWITTVLASAASFLVAPVYAFLDGCGQIRQVAQARFSQSAMVLLMSWGAMIAGHGLYAPAMVNLGVVIVGIVFISRRSRLLLGLLRYRSPGNSISWLQEIWPFQWRLAVSWLCTYFITQLFTPILFLVRGPVEAGRMGMSINIVAFLPLFVLSWISTKATPFGQLIKLGRLGELDRLFFRTFRQSMVVLLVIATGCMAAVVALPHVLPKIASRVEPPAVFALLLATIVSTFAVQCMAVYLRSFKEEPFMGQSATTALLTATGVALTASRWGGLGVAASYLLSHGLLGIAIAVPIFRSKRKAQRVGMLGFKS